MPKSLRMYRFEFIYHRNILHHENYSDTLHREGAVIAHLARNSDLVRPQWAYY